MSTYGRLGKWKADDFANADIWEGEVADALLKYFPTLINQTGSSTKLDLHVPEFTLELKEKRQRLGDRWSKWMPTVQEDSFIIDELSVRKALSFAPRCYFLLRDVPGDRMFITSISELASVSRGRVDRVGNTGHHKGKLLYNLREFTQVHSLDAVASWILQDINNKTWHHSGCLGSQDVETV